MYFISLIFFLLTMAQDPNVAIGELCLKKHAKLKNSKEVCTCVTKNLSKKLDNTLLQVLKSEYEGKSVSKELKEVEGASVVHDYNEDVTSECLKNSNWEVSTSTKK